jgi:hypothetical protein
LLALASPGARAFYIPGAFPNVFVQNATLHMRVNALTSETAELRHDYYSLPFCKPPGGPRRVAENLGEVLAGDRIATSAYAARLVVPGTAAGADEPPALLCQTRLSAADADALRQRIDEGYRAHMLLDTLPVRACRANRKELTQCIIELGTQTVAHAGDYLGAAAGWRPRRGGHRFSHRLQGGRWGRDGT